MDGFLVGIYCHLLEIVHIKRIKCVYVYLCYSLIDGTQCTTIDFPGLPLLVGPPSMRTPGTNWETERRGVCV
jgi:hypothetical protein